MSPQHRRKQNNVLSTLATSGSRFRADEYVRTQSPGGTLREQFRGFHYANPRPNPVAAALNALAAPFMRRNSDSSMSSMSSMSSNEDLCCGYDPYANRPHASRYPEQGSQQGKQSPPLVFNTPIFSGGPGYNSGIDTTSVAEYSVPGSQRSSTVSPRSSMLGFQEYGVATSNSHKPPRYSQVVPADIAEAISRQGSAMGGRRNSGATGSSNFSHASQNPEHVPAPNLRGGSTSSNSRRPSKTSQH